MKKTVIINIPMTAHVQSIVYVSKDASLPASSRAVGYPVVSFLEKTLQKKDQVTFLLLAKRSTYSKCEERMEELKEQMAQANEAIGAEIVYKTIYSDFDESKEVHEQLMQAIVEHIELDTHIIADITYGPKDLPIVVFAALNFAERFLGCSVDNIIYGQGVFNEEGTLEETTICDLSPLYALNNLTNTIRCKDPEQAKAILNSIITL